MQLGLVGSNRSMFFFQNQKGCSRQKRTFFKLNGSMFKWESCPCQAEPAQLVNDKGTGQPVVSQKTGTVEATGSSSALATTGDANSTATPQLASGVAWAFLLCWFEPCALLVMFCLLDPVASNQRLRLIQHWRC